MMHFIPGQSDECGASSVRTLRQRVYYRRLVFAGYENLGLCSHHAGGNGGYPAGSDIVAMNP
jgi:hypothetical protein